MVKGYESYDDVFHLVWAISETSLCWHCCSYLPALPGVRLNVKSTHRTGTRVAFSCSAATSFGEKKQQSDSPVALQNRAGMFPGLAIDYTRSMKVNTAVELLVQESFQLCCAMQQLSHSAASSLQNWLPRNSSMPPCLAGV